MSGGFFPTRMEQTFSRREWLEWLTKVRLLMIALILGVGVVWPQYIPSSGAPRLFLPIVILWITISILHLILVRLLPSVNWMGAVQVACDILLITALVYATGLQDSYFTSLYLLIIIVGSILFSRNAAFFTSLFCLFSLGLITGSGLHRTDSADLSRRARLREPAHVVPQQLFRLSCGCLSG